MELLLEERTRKYPKEKGKGQGRYIIAEEAGAAKNLAVAKVILPDAPVMTKNCNPEK